MVNYTVHQSKNTSKSDIEFTNVKAPYGRLSEDLRIIKHSVSVTI